MVHGSYATAGDEVAYSDFDGLIIVSKAMNKRPLADVAIRLHQLRKFMHLIDPFQHHGWFVLSEYDLDNYPEWFSSYSSIVSFKIIDRSAKLEIKVQVTPDVDFRKSFLRLCDSLKRKLSAGKTDWNLYQLKASSSEFMMLPSSYVQARDDKGIFQKV